MKVKELLNSEDKWCKNNYAKDKYGIVTGTYSDDACSWCLTGAIHRCYGYTVNQNIIEKLITKLKNISLIAWNDLPTTKFEDVKSLIEELDI